MSSIGRHLLGVVLLAGFAVVASGETVQGVLMDKACSAKAVSGGQQVAKDHTTECALLPDCQKSGYGVFTTDGKFLSFDVKGNGRATQLVKTTKKKDNLRITVDGTIQGDKITVSRIKFL